MQVFNFGSINIDLVYRVPHLVSPGETLASKSLQTVLGGKGANQSVALARAGVAVSHIGMISESDLWAREQIRKAGVDVTFVTSVEGASGHAIIQVDNAGENAIILHAGANALFDMSQLSAALQNAKAGDWLLMQNECNALEEAFALAREKNLRVAFNPAPMTTEILDLPLQQCDLLIVNETEALAMTGGEEDTKTSLPALADRFPKANLVLTLGAGGALAQVAGNRFAATAMPVEAVDTTGAGDTFVGYYLAALINNMGPQEALQRACAAAAISVTRPGAAPAIPAADEVDRFQREQNDSAEHT
jgi:ribokinase